MKRTLVAVLILIAVAAAVWYAVGGGEKPGPLGQGVGEELTRVGDILAAPDEFLGRTVTVEGRVVRQCPTTGCWWYLDDGTGQIRADSGRAGFALPPRQEGGTVRTTGTIARNQGGELELLATGAAVR